MNNNGFIIIILCFLLITNLSCQKNEEKTATVTQSTDLEKYEITNNVTSSAITSSILELIETEISSWIGNEVLSDAINKANSENKARTEEQVLELDEKWKNTEGIDEFIKGYLNNDAADFLSEIKDNSNGLYAEIFIMDFQGCNVAQTDKTSDFWQGDEDKFQISYNNGTGKIFIDSIEFDESTGINLVQVSLPISDPDNDRVIGAITIGLDINKLQ